MSRNEQVTDPNSSETFNAALAKWTQAAQEVEPSSPGKPISVLSGEALDVYYAATVNWEPVGKYPGMQSALVGKLVDDTTISDIPELAHAISRAQHLYLRAGSAAVAPAERGEYLVSELKQCLTFLFDDGKHENEDVALQRLNDSHSSTRTHDGLALALEGYCMFANDYREQLAQLPEFDVGMIDEGFLVAQRLREQSSMKLSGAQKNEQHRYLALRNGLVTLLDERLLKTRRAARFVFRNHPEIARDFGSGYERRQRAQQRAAKDASTKGATPTKEATL